MKEIIKYLDFGVELSTPEVMHFMECYPDNPLYEEMKDEYEEIKDELISLGKPQALFYFGEMPADIANEEAPEGASRCVRTVYGRRRYQRLQHKNV